MLLSMAPGLISLTPGVEFNALLAVTPLVNIVLLARDLFEGTVDPTLATAAVLTTALYALAAIGLAARVFGTDAILYGSEASWSDLFRRPLHARPVPSVSGAMFCLALLFPGCFLLRGLLAQMPYDSLSSRLVFNGLSTVVLFAGFPLVAAIVQRLPTAGTFRLQRARPPACGGAILLGVSLWPLAHEVYLLNEVIGLKALSPEQLQYAEKLLAGLHEVPLWLVLATLAVAPAVCEELLFRGYVLRALLAATSERNSIVISAVLFGGFHVLTTDALAAGRLLPSTFLGLILGWVAWRTASVVPGMLLHACHNGLLLTLGYYRDELTARGWGIQEQTHMPAAWLAAAAVGVIVGWSVVWTSGSSQHG
jgi:ABC-2 type transport system permease protein/sodium transport system permease protein